MRAAKAFALPLLLLVVAEIAARTYAKESFTVAPPSEVITALIRALRDGSLLIATGQTLTAAGLGLLVGGTLGFTAGILLGLNRHLDKLTKISVEVIRPLPPIAVIPIAMMIAGVGYSLEISVVAFATFWPTLILGRSAVFSLEPQLLEVAKVLNLSSAATIWKIVLPAILPRLIVATRLAIGFSLIAAVTAEIVANPMGMGFAMLTAQQALQPDLMLAFLVWIGFLGWGLNYLTIVAQQRLLEGKELK
jgi:NitT/TauT family transport system permease protein